MTVLFLIITALVAYVIGGVNGAIITSRYVFRKDIRDYGSGNAGLTNFFRTFGLSGILVVIGIDVVKSLVSVLLGGALLGIEGERTVGMLFGGFCVMLGHVAPAMYAFRGGKGVLCAGTMILLVDWRAGLCCWLIFIIVVAFTRYVSLASCMACLMGPVFMAIFGHSGMEVLLTLLCALMAVVKHGENILRLIGGTESRINFGGAKKK